MINLNCEVDFNDNKLFNKLFKKIYKKTNKIISRNDRRIVDVTFVSLDEIKKINKSYRNKNSVTDVISFALDESISSNQILGEIYICLEKAKQQAKEFNHSLKRELCFLFVHGLLHLYGYDHNNKKDEEIMFNLQTKILEKCKIYKES